MMEGREVGAQNRGEEEEGETGEKRAGCGSSQRVGRTRNSGSYATILINNIAVENGLKGGSREKKEWNGRWEAWITLFTNYY